MAIPTWRKPAAPWAAWAPFDEFERTMNRVFGDLYPTRTEYPPINVWTGKDDIILTAELPGREPKDLDITIHENTLMLRCAPEEKEQKPEESVTYHRRECVHEGFSRNWRLPFEVDGDKVEARLENGILQLMLPRSEASKPRKVQIKTK
jgi:HSP20 family protein